MKKIIPWLLILLALLPLADLLHPGLPNGHDTRDHVARIANFYQNLEEGTIVPRWGGNLNWGYGHPVMMFLYPLPSYVGSLFHAFGFSYVDSVKMVFAVAYVASILAMYAWSSAVWGTGAGIAAAILYGFAPYRFVDLYVRGAIGEHVAFIFPPLILLGLAKSRPLLVAAATAGLLLSHNALSLMFLPLAGLYALYLYWFIAKKSFSFLLRSAAGVLLGFGMAAFFLLPALMEGKYTLRDIVTAGDFATRFVPFKDLIYTPWSYGGTDTLPKHLGIAQLLVVLGSVWALFRNKMEKKKKIFGWGLIAILGIASFLMTVPSLPVWETVTILQKFQFPWRLLSVSVLVSAVLAAWLGKRIFLVCLLAVALTFPMWRASSYTIRPEAFYTEVYPSTTDTGESSPIWSVRFMEYAPAVPAEVIDGKADISVGNRTHTTRSYTIVASESSRIRENTLYFPGWDITVDGQSVPVEFQDPNSRGLMTYSVEPGMHDVQVVFGSTKLRRAADLISLASFGVFTLLGTIVLWKKKR